MKKYYIDTCIWRDYFEDRKGFLGKPLGKYAAKFFMKIMARKDLILFSKYIIYELEARLKKEEIEELFKMFFLLRILEKIDISLEQFDEAKLISKEKNLPLADALHAVVARDNDAVLITRDKHFENLKDIVKIRKPEELV